VNGAIFQKYTPEGYIGSTPEIVFYGKNKMESVTYKGENKSDPIFKMVTAFYDKNVPVQKKSSKTV